MNLQDAVRRLDAGEFDYSTANRAKVRGSARKCARLPAYNCPLDRIPAEPSAFSARWARHLDQGDFPEGFRSFESFRDWFSNVKGLMSRASGEHDRKKALRGAVDDWTRLHELSAPLVKRGRNAMRFTSGDRIALTVMRNFAREAGIQPNRTTADMVKAWIADATPQQKSTLRAAARALDKLRDFPTVVPAALLPAEPVGIIPVVPDHRTFAELPPKIARAVEEFAQERVRGTELPGLLRGRYGQGCGPETAQAGSRTLAWFFDALRRIGLIRDGEDPDPAEFADITVIAQVLQAEMQGRLSPKPYAPRTVDLRLNTVFRFLERYEPSLREERPKILTSKCFDGIREMTADNREFCQRLVRDRARTHTFLNLAATLFEKAAPMISRFDDLLPSEQHLARDLALGAALAAVLTFLPFRASTITELLCEGPDAHVWVDCKKGVVDFVVPGEIVKNRKKITGRIGKRGRVDPQMILSWWLSEARSHLLAVLQRPDPARLYGGAGYSRIAKAWKFATAECGLFMQLHQARHAIASILMNQPHPDVQQVAALLGDAPATVLRAYAFFDAEAAIARGQEGLRNVNKALSNGRR